MAKVDMAIAEQAFVDAGLSLFTSGRDQVRIAKEVKPAGCSMAIQHKDGSYELYVRGKVAIEQLDLVNDSLSRPLIKLTGKPVLACRPISAYELGSVVAEVVGALKSIEQPSSDYLEDFGRWKELVEYANPAVYGAINLCRTMNLKTPEVNYYIDDGFGGIAAKVELAWPHEKFAVAISMESALVAQKSGWEVVTVSEFVDGYGHVKQKLCDL
ncbi:hypothetical protein K0504_04550 [Neiella marina]|uniref:Uncharacterized protein n=1 Tax=Neiella holothuriorum TaxID=2870530 RepID=A0ABS7ED78_9GAMM|nr:hypothetical protein [Neiella holothuriorum]MBW8190299.1 hypothetical protein [Neiella holothuriorum]